MLGLLKLFTAKSMRLVPLLELTLAKLLLALTVTEESVILAPFTVVAASVLAVNVAESTRCWLASDKSAVALTVPVWMLAEDRLPETLVLRSRPEAVVAVKFRAF